MNLNKPRMEGNPEDSMSDHFGPISEGWRCKGAGVDEKFHDMILCI